MDLKKILRLLLIAGVLVGSAFVPLSFVLTFAGGAGILVLYAYLLNEF